MTISEFSSDFDVLLSSYTNQMAFSNDTTMHNLAFDEYEKSVFLTQAQEETVLSLYTGKNQFGESFEQTEEIRRYLANIVEDATLSPDTNSSGTPIGFGSKSKFFTLPDGSNDTPAVWFIIYEAVKVDAGDTCGKISLDVYPVTHDEYNKIRRNPFRGPNNRRALRLDLADSVVEIVSNYTTVSEYQVRYLRKPKPILLVDLTDTELSVGGENTIDENNPCELHEALHKTILENAVRRALASKGISINNNKKE